LKTLWLDEDDDLLEIEALELLQEARAQVPNNRPGEAKYPPYSWIVGIEQEPLAVWMFNNPEKTHKFWHWRDMHLLMFDLSRAYEEVLRE
jgi:hypothetical protein